MKFIQEQKGFSIVEIFIIIVILSIIGFIGYRIANNGDNETVGTENTEIQPANQEVNPISDKEDLNESVNKLQDIDLDTQDEEKELESLVN